MIPVRSCFTVLTKNAKAELRTKNETLTELCTSRQFSIKQFHGSYSVQELDKIPNDVNKENEGVSKH